MRFYLTNLSNQPCLITHKVVDEPQVLTMSQIESRVLLHL